LCPHSLDVVTAAPLNDDGHSIGMSMAMDTKDKGLATQYLIDRS
jgi:hypothetical protein